MRLAAAAAGKALLFKLRPARPGEGKRLHAIEMAAGELFREIGMDDIADAPGTPASVYETSISAGRALVCCAGDIVAGFLTWDHCDGRAFVCEVSVDTRFHGKGLGAQLIAALEHPSLSCFVDTPWNKPYYDRLGFRAVDPKTLGPAHVSIAKDEAKRFAPWPRCVMVKY